MLLPGARKSDCYVQSTPRIGFRGPPCTRREIFGLPSRSIQHARIDSADLALGSPTRGGACRRGGRDPRSSNSTPRRVAAPARRPRLISASSHSLRTLGRWNGGAQLFRASVETLPPGTTDVAVLLQPVGLGPIISAATLPLPPGLITQHSRPSVTETRAAAN